MAFELVTVLLGAAAGCVLVTFAARRGYLGHPRRKGSSAAASTKGYSPATGQAEAPAPPEPAPSPPPATYESVQPAAAPPIPFSTSSAPTTIANRRPTRTYRRRAAPKRPAASQDARAPEKPETEQ